MSYRVCRKTISTTFTVQGQLCKVFMEPVEQYKPTRWLWNVGFAVGRSRRQLNDWYWKRKNRRARSLEKQLVGTSGMRTITRGFNEVLRLRWFIPPGDAIFLDCTSGDPDRQFHAWSRWHRYHPEWCIDYDQKKFFWYRPPYPDDAVWDIFDITPVTPADPKANCVGERYFDCFRVRPKSSGSGLSMDQTLALLGQVL